MSRNTRNTHPLGQERMAAHQPLLGINPADGRGGERRQQARTVAGWKDSAQVQVGPSQGSGKESTSSPGLNKKRGGNLQSSWRQMPAIQKKLEINVWNKEEGSVGEMGLVGNSPLRNVARICPSCIFCSPQLLFTKPLANKFMGKSLEEDFEHLLIADEVFVW